MNGVCCAGSIRRCGKEQAVRIMVLEDDLRLSQALQRILEEAGYEVEAVSTGADALDVARTRRFDALVLDVMVPAPDGMEVTRALRREGDPTPILLLTALSSTSNKVSGLDAGADDYLPKPFAPSELLARLRAITRRQGEVVFETLSAGDLTLRLDDAELSCAGEAGPRALQLSPREFELARMLMECPGRVFSKAAILERAWSVDAAASQNNVEAYVSFLRKKLAYLGSLAKIETVRGMGYRLAVPERRAGTDEPARP